MEEHHINKRRKTQEIINNTNSSRKIKLYCPAASKIAELIACENQKLDIGIIARIFGVEPATLKINGHFISRGVDLIASSVTWKSLLSFFSSRGLSTGTNSSGALIVNGKLAKCLTGTKKGDQHSAGLDNSSGIISKLYELIHPAPGAHDSTPEVEKRVNNFKLYKEGGGFGQTSQHEEINSPIFKKMRERNNVCENGSRAAKCSDTCLKRNNWLENISPLMKRMRVNGSYSNEFAQGDEVRECCIAKLQCAYPSRGNVKRSREDDVIMAASCKRTRGNEICFPKFHTCV